MCFAFVLAALGWVAVRRHATASRRLLAAGYTVAVLIVAAVWAGIDTVGQEFQDYRYSTVSGRVDVWRDTGRIVQDFPLTGTGLNTFEIAIREYQTYDLDFKWNEAHGDYLQLAAEGGLLLGVPIVITILFVREVRRRFRDKADDTPSGRSRDSHDGDRIAGGDRFQSAVVR